MWYYGAVVLNDKRQPIFNGTPEDTKKWVLARQNDEEVQKSVVCDGRTLRMVSFAVYITK